jgi:predicted ABC-type ATPase
LEEVQLISGILSFKGKAKAINSYMASFIATFLCEKLIISGQSFCFETVLSHPSKIELLRFAKSYGYKTYLYFIFTENWQLNVERVKLRVLEGGHDVSHKKIESRYYKSLRNFSTAAQGADSTILIDNSKAFTRIAELKNGNHSYLINPFPEWFREYYNPNALQ